MQVCMRTYNTNDMCVLLKLPPVGSVCKNKLLLVRIAQFSITPVTFREEYHLTVSYIHCYRS